jgi:zinc protease
LFGVMVRVKNAADLPSIEQQVIATAEGFAARPVDAKKLEALKEHLRYEFALQLNNSESIASTVAQYVALRRTPETINRYYDAYAKVTPADIQKAARKYLVEKNRNVVTLTSKAGGQ